MSTGQALGGIVGGVIGGMMGNAVLGAQAGIMLGGVIDPPSAPKMKRPSLADLQQQVSTYGANIPRVYGQIATYGEVIWLKGNKLRVKDITPDGKGSPSATSDGNVYEYYATFAVCFAKGEIEKYGKIWFGNKLVYDPANDSAKTTKTSTKFKKKHEFYLGTEDQEPSPTIESDVGAGNAPAYRGHPYIVFKDVLLTEYGNSLSGLQVKAELISKINSVGVQKLGYTDCEVIEPYSSSYAPVSHYIGSDKVLFYAPAWGPGVGVGDELMYVYEVTESTGFLKNIIPTNSDGVGSNPRQCVGNDRKMFWPHANDLNGGVGGLAGSTQNRHVSGYNIGLTMNATNELWVCENAFDPVSRQLAYQPDVTSIVVSGGGFTALAATMNDSHTRVYLVCDDGLRVYSIGLTLLDTYSFSVSGYDRCCYYVDDEGKEFLWLLDFTGAARLARIDLDNPAGGIAYSTSITLTSSSYIDPEFNVADGMIVIAHNKGGTPPKVTAEWFLIKSESTVKPTLDEIVKAECLRSNLLEESDLDTSALTSEVSGYKITDISSIRAALEPLQAAYPFDVYQSGYQLKFVPRGNSSVATFTEDDLAESFQIKRSREMDTQIPRKVIVKYFDAARDYDVNEQYSERLNTDAVSVEEKGLAIVLTSDEAAQIAEKLLYMYWLEREDFEFILPPSARDLEPSDVITITTDYADFNLRLTSINYGVDGRLKCTAKPNNASAYTSSAVGGEGSGTNTEISGAGSDTDYTLLDIPCVNSLKLNMPGIYAAINGSNSADWKGGSVLKSIDSGANFTTFATSTSPTTFGFATDYLGAITQSNRIDYGANFNISFLEGSPESVTTAQLLNGYNLYAYGAPDRWEIIAVQTWTLEGDGTYTGSQIMRGLFGTESFGGEHLQGDKLIHLNDSDLVFSDLSINSLNIPYIYRGISAGQSIDSDTDYTFTYTGVNLKPLKPVHVRYYKSTDGSWYFSWVRQDRAIEDFADGVDAPMSEADEKYATLIYSDNTYTTVLREIITTKQNSQYTPTDQVTDGTDADSDLYFAIFQISKTAGYGYPSNDSAIYVVPDNTTSQTPDDGVDIVDAGGDSTTYVLLSKDPTGIQKPVTDANITYNASNGQLSSKLTCPAGGTVSGSAAQYFTTGSLLTTPAVGAWEFDGEHLYFTANSDLGREMVMHFANLYATSQSGLSSGSFHDIYQSYIPLYDDATYQTAHEIEIDVIYQTSTSCTVTFELEATTGCVSSAWDTRVIHSRLAGVITTSSGAPTTGTINSTNNLLGLDLSSSGVVTKHTFSAAVTAGNIYHVVFKSIFINQPNLGGTNLINPKIKVSTGTVDISGTSSWKVRIASPKY